MLSNALMYSVLVERSEKDVFNHKKRYACMLTSHINSKPFNIRIVILPSSNYLFLLCYEWLTIGFDE
jgi:hypothetical protein